MHGKGASGSQENHGVEANENGSGYVSRSPTVKFGNQDKKEGQSEFQSGKIHNTTKEMCWFNSGKCIRSVHYLLLERG